MKTIDAWLHPSTLRRAALAAAAAAAALAACGGGSEEPPPPAEPVTSLGAPEREWRFQELRGSGRMADMDAGIAAPGELLQQRDIGRVSVRPPNRNERADLEVYSDADGATYWVDAEAPLGDAFDAQSRIGGRSLLILRESYRKNALDATLRLTITAARLQVLDYNGAEPLLARCPWATAVTAPDVCFDNLYAGMSMQVLVTSGTSDAAPGPVQLYQLIEGAAALSGWHGHWDPVVNSDNDAIAARSEDGLIHRVLWRRSDFELQESDDGVAAELALPGAFPVDVDLTLVPLGSEFTVEVAVLAVAENRRGRESYAGARLRDPQQFGGVASTYAGLTPTHRPARAPVLQPAAAPACASPANPAAGTLQFSQAQYALPEFRIAGPVVHVTRTGGSSGTIAARLTTQDATARAGTDYVARELDIVFGDGDTLPRAIRLAAVDDAAAQGHRTFRVTLNDAHNCGAIGSPALADVLIVDDEYRAPAQATYTLGGALSGLQGSGLVLEEVATGSRLTPAANGAFVFGYRFPDASAYDVRVVNQPANPSQTCTVSDGRGTITGADVANVRVECAASTPASGLDASFADGGRLHDADLPAGRAVAIQGSGRIVVLAGMNLAAYDTNGRRDTAFGAGGIAPVVFNDGFQDEAYGLLRQPDDKLVVVGRTRVGPYFHMAVKRFNADGSVDTGFGSNGLTTLDPYASMGADSRSHYAYRAVLAPDNRIVVAGIASYFHPVALEQRQNIAVARLNPDGSPDAGFGSNGTSTGDVAGGADWGFALALSADGKIVVAGRTGTPRGTFAVLMRFRADGPMDTGDPRLPEHYGRDGSGYLIFDTPFNTGSGQDMVMLPDGSVVVATPIAAAHPTLGVATRFGLAPATANGAPLPLRDTVIGPDNDMPRALLRLTDGRLLTVGLASNDRGGDFGIVRYLPDLSRDAAFGTGGVLQVDFFGAADDAAGAALQPDGRVVIVGAARNGANVRLGIVRLLP